MTTIELELPEELAEPIRGQGRLNPDGLREMLRESLRFQSIAFISELVEKGERLGIPVMSEEEIQAEVDAVRDEWKPE